MKKYAFTLMENLLAMAIIGICATLMITSIKNVNPTGQANAIMAKKAVTTFTGATKQMMIHHAKSFKMNDVYTDTAKTSRCSNSQCLFNLYGKFVQITKSLNEDEAGNLGPTGTVYGQLADGLVFGIRYDSACSIVTTADNIYTYSADDAIKLVVTNSKKACGLIYYDVNGKKGPNKNGEDRFALPIFSSGIQIPSVAASTPSST